LKRVLSAGTFLGDFPTKPYLLTSGIRKGVMEIAYLALYGLRSSDLSGLAVRVVADEVGIEQVVYQLRLALAEGLFQKLSHLSLVLFGHELIPPSEVGSLADASNPRPYQPLGKASMTTR
jgi:hypothetical protein